MARASALHRSVFFSTGGEQTGTRCSDYGPMTAVVKPNW